VVTLAPRLGTAGLVLTDRLDDLGFRPLRFPVPDQPVPTRPNPIELTEPFGG
jgi:hypothetical protein